MTQTGLAAAAGLIASSAAMIDLLNRVARSARSPDPVAIVGETGTGKSTVARLLHELSGRPGRPVEISAGELNTALAQDDLFGHGRGAFTGAVTRRRGLFEEAAGGTALLEEFHRLRRANQERLLRVLDRHEFRHLGDDRGVPFDARVLVGSHCSLDELMRRGRLIEDLRWRLGLHEIWVPPLRDRWEDITPLARHFLVERLAESGGVGPSRLQPQAVAVLELAPWPGNARQLRAVVRRAFTEAEEADEIAARHLDLAQAIRFSPSASWDVKRRLVRWALWRAEGQVTEAAGLIGAHRNTVAAIREKLEREAGADPGVAPGD